MPKVPQIKWPKPDLPDSKLVTRLRGGKQVTMTQQELRHEQLDSFITMVKRRRELQK